MCAIEVSPVIGTDRLILRRPATSDAAELCQLANDPAIAGMLPSMPHPCGPRQADEFLARAADWREPDFAVEHREFGLIGMLGFSEKTRGRPEVGYWIGRPFWGRGYATEALRGALAWLHVEWRRRAVWAGHCVDNSAAGQVLSKAGFLYTGDIEQRHSLGRNGTVLRRRMVWLA